SHRYLPSFPTRRSSDLEAVLAEAGGGLLEACLPQCVEVAVDDRVRVMVAARLRRRRGVDRRSGGVSEVAPDTPVRRQRHAGDERSEEHTSELQSLAYLV